MIAARRVIGAALSFFVACSDSPPLECGPGTRQSGARCVVAIDEDAGAAERDAGVATQHDGGAVAHDAGVPVKKRFCDSNSQCVPGEVCAIASRTCISASGAVCGMPSLGGGGQYLGAVCSSVSKCDSAFTCVAGATSRALGDAGTYELRDGRCMFGCNPCAPNCPGTMSCMALGSGQVGGVCHSGSLGAEGTTCNRSLCQGMCPTASTPVCTAPLCVPDDRSLIASALPGTAALSADCEEGEWCVKQSSYFACQRGTAVPHGGKCGGFTFCAEGGCALGINVCLRACPCAPDAGVCSTTGSVLYCLPDGVLPVGAACSESRSCESWLECRGSQCLPKP